MGEKGIKDERNGMKLKNLIKAFNANITLNPGLSDIIIPGEYNLYVMEENEHIFKGESDICVINTGDMFRTVSIYHKKPRYVIGYGYDKDGNPSFET